MILLLAVACDRMAPWPVDPDSGTGGERIAVSPAELDFGEVSVTLQGDATRTLTLYNLGSAPVTVTGQDEPVGDDEQFRVGALPVLNLDVGEEVTVDVDFVPTTEGTYAAHLRFQPGDEVVDLRGVGHAPVLVTHAAALPATVLGCSGLGEVLLENRGAEALSVLPTASGDDFEVVGWEDDIGPGESAPVTVRFTPTAGGERAGLLLLDTNDPLHPQASVPLSALGYEGAHVTESFVYAPARDTDVIFAVEGGALAGDARLGPALDAYAERMVAAQVDVRLASIPTAGPCAVRAPLWAELGDSALRMVTVLENGFDGASGPWDADLVGLVETTLWHAEPGGCVDGFRREDAALELVLIGATAPSADPTTTWQALRDTLPEETEVRIDLLVADGDACTGAEAYLPLAAATEGVVGNLCGASWEEAFTAFASLPRSTREMRYPLAEEPVTGTVEVRADGVPLTSWTWDADANAVVIGVESPPDFGAELHIDYVSAVSCSP